jgi:hypothetical protein
MSEPTLVFGHACPQHPSSEIAQATCHPVTSGQVQGWLVTVRYACSHRQTQFTKAQPSRVSDTLDREHPVIPAVS